MGELREGAQGGTLWEERSERTLWEGRSGGGCLGRRARGGHLHTGVPVLTRWSVVAMAMSQVIRVKWQKSGGKADASPPRAPRPSAGPHLLQNAGFLPWPSDTHSI